MTEEVRQDMPPKGGYRNFNFNRTYAKTLFKRRLFVKKNVKTFILAHYVVPTLVVMGFYGFYQTHMQKRQNL